MELIDYECHEGVAVLTINNPPVNAFSSAVWSRLMERLDSIAQDPSVLVGILTAAGTRAFSAGADVKEAATRTSEEKALRAQLVIKGLKTLYQVPIPMICAINAPVAGGGVNVATLCDYRIASDQAHFSLPEIRYGARAGGGAFLRRIGVPAGATRAMIFSGSRCNAEDALAIHLVDELVPPEQLLVRANQLAASMSIHGRDALISIKRAAMAVEADLDLFDAYDRASSS